MRNLSEGMELSAEEDVLPSEFNFDDVFVGGERDKGLKKSRSERRERRYEYARVQRGCEGDINLNISKEKLWKLQAEDPIQGSQDQIKW